MRYLGLLALVLVVSGCGGGAPEAPPPASAAAAETEPDFAPVPPVKAGDAALVRFVKIPGCVLCEKIDGQLAGMQQKYGAQLKAERYESTNPEARKFLRGLKLSEHGIVVFDRGANVCWSYDGHSLKPEDFDRAVDAAVKKK